MAAYQVPPSPDYIPGPEVPPSPDYIPGPEVPPSPDYIPGPEVPPSPDYIPGPEEPQSPPPLDLVPDRYSPGYVPESDPEEDNEDPEEDPADYPANRDDDDDDEDEDEDEDEHPAPAVIHLSTVHRMTCQDIVLRDEPSISLPPREEVERLLALTTPPPSPLTPLSSPLPPIPSPPLPIPSPPPDIPTHIETPESCLPLWKRVRFASPTPSHEVGESSAAGAARQDGPAVAREDPYSVARGDLYGFVDMVDVPPRCSTSRELDYGITDAWDDLRLITKPSWIRDRPIHSRLAVMVDREARMAHEAWGLSMDTSDYASSHFRSHVINYYRVQLTKALELLKGLQTQMAEFQRQHGPAKGPAQPDAPGEAGNDYTRALLLHLAHMMPTRNGDIAILSGTVPEGLCKFSCNATYPPDIPKMPTLNFKGTEGVVDSLSGLKKMKSIYSISNYTVACQVKFAKRVPLQEMLIHGGTPNGTRSGKPIANIPRIVTNVRSTNFPKNGTKLRNMSWLARHDPNGSVMRSAKKLCMGAIEFAT
ncbi:hypothetical protein Tco_0099625 [Tanacetum coccineum]